MDTLIIQLGSDEIRLKPQDTLDGILEVLKNREVHIDPDPEMNRTYLELTGDGMDIVFKGDQLSSVFLFLDPIPPRTDRFQGHCNILSERFFVAPSHELFVSEMAALGLVKNNRKYPNAVDYLNEHIRVRLERRNGSSMILIDDGSFLRANK